MNYCDQLAFEMSVIDRQPLLLKEAETLRGILSSFSRRQQRHLQTGSPHLVKIYFKHIFYFCFKEGLIGTP